MLESPLTYSVKSEGPRTEPYGNSPSTGLQVEPLEFIFTSCLLPTKKSLSHFKRNPTMPRFSGFNDGLVVSTLTNALLKSMKTTSTEFPLSGAFVHCSLAIRVFCKINFL